MKNDQQRTVEFNELIRFSHARMKPTDAISNDSLEGKYFIAIVWRV